MTRTSAAALKTILITGATDGIGLEAAKLLASQGHRVLLHGRSQARLDAAAAAAAAPGSDLPRTFLADLSRASGAEALAAAVLESGEALDVLINNAGVFSHPDPVTPDGLDVRFAVNAIATHVLSRRLAPHLAAGGRVVNVASAGQAPVDLEALAGRKRLPAMEAYAQSKLALIACTRHNAAAAAAAGPGGVPGPGSPVYIAVNPGSLLATKMVQEAFGMAGKDVGIGARTLARAALDPEFGLEDGPGGRYFCADAGRFRDPHPAAMDAREAARVVAAVEAAAGLEAG